MRKIAAALSLAVSAALVAVPATDASAAKPKKRSYAVTLNVSGTPMVGSPLTFKGKVKGPGAGGLKVTVQRRDGAAWRKVTTTKTNRKGKYKARVKLTNAGATAFRVRTAKSAQRKAGTSKAVAQTVTKWLDLTREAGAVNTLGAINHGVTMGGRRYATSFQGRNWLDVAFQSGGLCSTLEFTMGFADADAGSVTNETRSRITVRGLRSTDDFDPVMESDFEVGPGAPVRQSVNVSAATFVALNGSISPSGGSTRVVIAEPRMLCAVDALPEFSDAALADL